IKINPKELDDLPYEDIKLYYYGDRIFNGARSEREASIYQDVFRIEDDYDKITQRLLENTREIAQRSLEMASVSNPIDSVEIPD
ncbi:15061_t:CDS:2, partial [Racocetra persica]